MSDEHLWARDMPGMAMRGGPPPRLLSGHAGHPCASCGSESIHEFSPSHYRADTFECLLRQNPGDAIIQAVRRRNGIPVQPKGQTPTVNTP